MTNIKSTCKFICLFACVLLLLVYMFGRIKPSDVPHPPNQVRYRPASLHSESSRIQPSDVPHTPNKVRYNTSLHSESETCSHSAISGPAKNIYFLKVHKCASTVIASLLTRYAAYHNLTVALPSRGMIDPAHISWPVPLTPNHVYHYKDGRKINMMTLHTVYNRSAVNEIMPPDTLKIAIIREPLSQFWSAFDYFNYGVSTRGRVDILTYLKNPEKHERPLSHKTYGKKYIKNFIMTEFGYPDRNVNDEETVKQFARQISDEFDLVLLQEHMYESVILLRRLLCWKFKDVIVTRSFNQKDLQFKKHLAGDETLRELHTKWSRGDYIFYDYFRLKFDALIKAQDESFVKEVEHYENVVEKLKVFCKEKKVGMEYIEPESKWNPELVIRPADCKEYFNLHVDAYHTIQIKKFMKKTV